MYAAGSEKMVRVDTRIFDQSEEGKLAEVSKQTDIQNRVGLCYQAATVEERITNNVHRMW